MSSSWSGLAGAAKWASEMRVRSEAGMTPRLISR